ncbi:hypothetical protein EVA_08243 [gut metagenome]|uniref:Uncharacterized protein n=1 Tax=gut metagenome TaxID=749906 RepID=J9GN03_9ZZZZ
MERTHPPETAPRVRDLHALGVEGSDGGDQRPHGAQVGCGHADIRPAERGDADPRGAGDGEGPSRFRKHLGHFGTRRTYA